MKQFSISILLCFLFASCHKDNSSQTQFSVADFPIKEGNWWRYKKSNIQNNIIDTIRLRVIKLNANGVSKEYACIIEKGGQIVDSATLTLDPNLIKYQGADLEYSYFCNFFIQMPFSVTSSWKNQAVSDSTKVVAYISGENINGKSYNTYLLERKASGPNFGLQQTISVAKGIGIVVHELSLFNLGPVQHYKLELIDYDVN